MLTLGLRNTDIAENAYLLEVIQHDVNTDITVMVGFDSCSTQSGITDNTEPRERM